MYKSLEDLKPPQHLKGLLTPQQGRAIALAIRNHRIKPCCETSKALRIATGERNGTPIWRDD